MRTYRFRRRRGGGRSRKRRHVALVNAPATETRTTSATTLKRRIVECFFEILLMVKLYHWNTYSYSTHKATDELYSKLGDNIDRFMEVFLGKTAAAGMDPMGGRIKGLNSIKMINIDDKKEMAIKIGELLTFLDKLGGELSLFSEKGDLLTIRDEIIADLNQFLYLLTLH